MDDRWEMDTERSKKRRADDGSEKDEEMSEELWNAQSTTRQGDDRWVHEEYTERDELTGKLTEETETGEQIEVFDERAAEGRTWHPKDKVARGCGGTPWLSGKTPGQMLRGPSTRVAGAQARGQKVAGAREVRFLALGGNNNENTRARRSVMWRRSGLTTGSAVTAGGCASPRGPAAAFVRRTATRRRRA